MNKSLIRMRKLKYNTLFFNSCYYFLLMKEEEAVKLKLKIYIHPKLILLQFKCKTTQMKIRH